MQVILRAAGSTIVIAVVAYAVTAVRLGRVDLQDFEFLIVDYWRLFLAIFFALAIWDYWFWRVRRFRVRHER